MPFNNNDGIYFKAEGKINESGSSARAQGSAFIVKCLKSLLAAKLEETFVIDQNPDSQTISKNEIDTLFSPFGQSRILVHLDEHRHMYIPD